MIKPDFEATGGSVQTLILSLIGRFVIDHLDRVTLRPQLCIEALGPGGVPEKTVRTTLSRMVERGLLKRQRTGRPVAFDITPAGRAMLAQGRTRLYSETPFGSGENIWTFLTITQSVGKVGSRYQLHTLLNWAGFARIDARLWMAPGRIDVIGQLGQSLSASALDKLLVFQGASPHEARFDRLVKKTWNLSSIRAAHHQFREKWDRKAIEHDELFQLLAMINDWAALLEVDPGLPALFNSDGFSSQESRKVFVAALTRLGPAADRQFADIVARTDAAGQG
tara:strand:+ start:45 stop:884 length:840 start_codon:yes stop_codon:yes gene_type:complete